MGALGRLAVASVVWLCVLVGGLVLGSEGALAGVTHEYLSQITTVPATGPAPGEESVPLPGPFGNVHGLAVDGGGLYVADGSGSEYRLDKFAESSGAFVEQFAQVPALYYLHDGVAVAHASGEVYVGGDEDDSHEGAVAVFGAGGALLGTWTGADTESGSFGCLECGGGEAVTAVDNSGSLGDWAAGDVYVADPQHGVVDVFKPGPGGAEEYVTRLEGSEPGAPFTAPSAVAVNAANGDVLVVDAQSVVDVFEPVSGMPGVYQLLFRITDTPAGALSGVAGLAVDSGNGDIYLSSGQGGNGVVDEFGSTGVYLGRLRGTPAGSFGGAEGLAVDPVSHHLFVGDFRGAEGGVVDVFGPDLVIPDAVSEPATGVQPTSAALHGTVNPSGVLVSDCHFEYGPTAAYGQSVPCAQSPAEIASGNAPVAVSANLTGLTAGTVYHYRLVASNAHNVNGPSVGQDRLVGAPQIDSSSAGAEAQTKATLEGQVNPDGVDTTYRFEYGTSTAYGTSVPVPDGDIGAGESDVPLNAELTGLPAGVTYHYRLVAANVAGTVQSADGTFTTIAPALIDSVTITNITSSAVSLHAQINPLGNDTTYRFEYGPSTAYGSSVPVPDGDVGSGSSDVTVTQQLVGLAANTTYHVRVVAHNTLGTTRGVDHTFVYDTSGGGLPDNRAYELVTPPHKNGALIGDVLFGLPPEVSEDGERVMSSAIQCFAGAVSCNAHRTTEIGASFEFARTSGGWITTPLGPPAAQLPVSSPWQFNANAGTALFRAPTAPGGEDDLYGRKPDGSLLHIGPVTPPANGSLRPGSASANAATFDLAHIVWETSTQSSGEDIGEQWPFDSTVEGGPSVYEYVGASNSQPVLVGVGGGLGSTALISTCGTTLGDGSSGGGPGVLSDDGSVVFFTALAGGVGCSGVGPVTDEVYARVDQSRTVAISQRSPGDCTGVCLASLPGDALFKSATGDGSRVLFLSTQQLMNGASEDSHSGDSATHGGCAQAAGLNGCNLYLYDSSNPAGHELVDVSAGDSSGGGPRVQGVMEVSADESHVYFVAKGVLSSVANTAGQSARDGANNLYMFERDAAHPAGRVAFIAALPAADEGEWTNVILGPANVTPDGRFLVFVSSSRLTADDTSVSGAEQVFRYDAQTGALARLSIGDDGFNDNGNRVVPSPCGGGGVGCSEDATIVDPYSGARRDPTMSHDGSDVFFRSPLALTPRALDDVQIGTVTGTSMPAYAQNVYEWHEGHVHLISDGRDVHRNAGPSGVCGGGISSAAEASAVCLLGVDGSGANVFFTTTDALVGQDVDTELDYYDARVCTPGDPCIPSASAAPAGCEGDACHGTPPVAPALSGVATATFSGSGNLVTPGPVSRRPAAKKAPAKCAGGKRPVHGKCAKKGKRGKKTKTKTRTRARTKAKARAKLRAKRAGSNQGDQK